MWLDFTGVSNTAPRWSNRIIAGSYIRSYEIKQLLNKKRLFVDSFLLSIMSTNRFSPIQKWADKCLSWLCVIGACYRRDDRPDDDHTDDGRADISAQRQLLHQGHRRVPGHLLQLHLWSADRVCRGPLLHAKPPRLQKHANGKRGSSTSSTSKCVHHHLCCFLR